MTAKLVFLGRLEELAGSGDAVLPLGAPLTWAELTERLSQDYAPALADMISGTRVKIALNGALIADKEALVLNDGDEIAFLPPVSGG